MWLSTGGRVTGAEVISELIFELDASVEAAAGFEGEMQRLAGYARWAQDTPHPPFQPLLLDTTSSAHAFDCLCGLSSSRHLCHCP